MVEVYNDLDGEIVNLFRVLRDESAASRLCDLLSATPYARTEFVGSYEPVADPVEQARRTVVRSFMGFGSDSASGAQTGFRANGNRQNGHPARDWANLPPKLGAVIERLRGVVVECRAGAEIVRQHDAPDTLHYVDPPYARVTRSSHTMRKGKGYRHEMTDDDHRELAAVLRGAQGMVVISGYASPLYDEELFPEWDRREKSTHADGALARTEVVWLNPACRSALAQVAA